MQSIRFNRITHCNTFMHSYKKTQSTKSKVEVILNKKYLKMYATF